MFGSNFLKITFESEDRCSSKCEIFESFNFGWKFLRWCCARDFIPVVTGICDPNKVSSTTPWQFETGKFMF